MKRTIIIEITEDESDMSSKITINPPPAPKEMESPEGSLFLLQMILTIMEGMADTGTMKGHAKACLKDGTVIAESDLSE